MKEVKINSMVKLHTLLLLNQKKVHGYEIMKALKASLKVPISASQVYPFLALLKKHGYINHTKADKRDKKEYYPTQTGRELLRKITSRFGAVIDLAIQSKIRKCAHCDCEVYKGGHEQRIRGKALYFCCENCARSYKV
ncbi:helix-turn-helix transcriptional regulator [Candidatus Woesearchaeota archaeon]|nr:helix-turn-helix transcriptional regulator [Candidatus Woesearchaeota archaeon]